MGSMLSFTNTRILKSSVSLHTGSLTSVKPAATGEFHLWYSALSSIGGRQDFIGCPDADMDLTWRGRVETVAPGDGEGDAAGTSGRLQENHGS